MDDFDTKETGNAAVARSINYCELSYQSTKDLLKDYFFCFPLKEFFLLHCVPLYVCRLCINYQDLSTKLLGVGALRMLLLTFISHL